MDFQWTFIRIANDHGRVSYLTYIQILQLISKLKIKQSFRRQILYAILHRTSQRFLSSSSRSKRGDDKYVEDIRTVFTPDVIQAISCLLDHGSVSYLLIMQLLNLIYESKIYKLNFDNSTSFGTVGGTDADLRLLGTMTSLPTISTELDLHIKEL